MKNNQLPSERQNNGLCTNEKLATISQTQSPALRLPYSTQSPQVPLKPKFSQQQQMEPYRISNPQPRHLRMLAGDSHRSAPRPKYEKRSVNSFMAFRSFYKAMFPKLQQKDASTFLTTLWKNEPFKAKWTIIAKAYSSIRDALGKQRASLLTYLTLVCPKMGIIDAEDYSRKMNWKFETTADGTNVLKQTTFPDLSCFERCILYTNMTPNDIINFCAEMAYIPQQIAIQISGVGFPNSIGASPTTRMPQHSLLASCPIIPQLNQFAGVLEPGVIPNSTTDSQLTETSFETVSISDDANDGGYQWIESMSDLYDPAEGSIDLDNMLRNQEAIIWEAAHSCMPQSFDSLAQNSDMCDRYVFPSVPNSKAQNLFL